MLLEIAIGDAYGAGFEYANSTWVRARNNLASYVRHPRHGIPPGNYTDDTQMSMAIAELILSGVDWSKRNIARFFLDSFQRDPREGYASNFFRFLNEVGSADEFVDKIRPESDKSGAAMRAVPIGVYDSIAEVIERSTLQARLTHDTRDGIRAAVAASLMSHYFLYRIGPARELGNFLEAHIAGQWNTPWRREVGAKGWMAVQAAVTAVMESDRMSELLVKCVDFEGDVDTVAAIALGAASASNEIAQDLPAHLHESLEQGRFGRPYLIELDRKLRALVGRPAADDPT